MFSAFFGTPHNKIHSLLVRILFVFNENFSYLPIAGANSVKNRLSPAAQAHLTTLVMKF